MTRDESRKAFQAGYEWACHMGDAPEWHLTLLDLWCQWTGGHIGGSEFNEMVSDLITEHVLTAKVTPRPEAQPRICYMTCKAHEGMTFTLQLSGWTVPAITVCPICNPPPASPLTGEQLAAISSVHP